jgi:hypothetical protein
VLCIFAPPRSRRSSCLVWGLLECSRLWGLYQIRSTTRTSYLCMESKCSKLSICDRRLRTQYEFLCLHWTGKQILTQGRRWCKGEYLIHLASLMTFQTICTYTCDETPPYKPVNIAKGMVRLVKSRKTLASWQHVWGICSTCLVRHWGEWCKKAIAWKFSNFKSCTGNTKLTMWTIVSLSLCLVGVLWILGIRRRRHINRRKIQWFGLKKNITIRLRCWQISDGSCRGLPRTPSGNSIAGKTAKSQRRRQVTLKLCWFFRLDNKVRRANAHFMIVS